MTVSARQVQLVRRPEALARPSDFRMVEVKLPDIQEGQILVRNMWMSVDPYMRRSMEPVATDLEPWPLNAALSGPSIGRVVASRHPKFTAGDLVESMSGWQDLFISNGAVFVPYLSPANALAKRTAAGAVPRDYVGLLGVAALTAYAGMACFAAANPGETAVVSSGAGTVGSIGCQIAKVRGLRVVSSAGSDDKVRWLEEVAGVDLAFNYRKQSIAAALKKACPKGIDLVLENASQDHMSACLPLMNELKQILIAGFVSIYDTGGRVPPFENFEYVLDKFLTIRSYRFMDALDRYDTFVSDMIRWRSEGRMTLRESVFDGIEKAPDALCSLFDHSSFGKVLVRIAEN
jgi:NADPH-dependent curcumin reductase CurA